MNQQNDPASITPEAVQTTPAPSRRHPVIKVSQCGLQLTKVRLVMLMCTPGESTVEVPPMADLNYEGKLVKSSLKETSFQAIVTWSLCFPEGVAAPVAISGRHELTFLLNKQISENDASYYAETNSVILVYPYLRQLIDDLSIKSLGRSIMILPLDVPQFVTDQMMKRQPTKEPQTQGVETDPDGKEGT